MHGLEQPIWQLVLKAAEHLDASVGDFRLIELIKEVQLLESSCGRTSISPVVQGMTANAGKGPPSPCGQPLVRVAHGRYRLSGEVHEVVPRSSREVPTAQLGRTRHLKERRDNEVDNRVAGLIDDFAACVDTYDQKVPFTRSGQYSHHRATIDRRRSFASVREALDDDVFLDDFYQTLYAWGIGKRASRLVPRAQFGNRLRACGDEIASFEHLRLDDSGLDATATATDLWRLIERLGVVENVSLIVPGTKTLHHLLPDLVPPMDRAWTGAFFLWTMAAPQYERPTFFQSFSYFANIAQATDPSLYVGDGWRTSVSKITDNAIIGYCKLHNIASRGQ